MPINLKGGNKAKKQANDRDNTKNRPTPVPSSIDNSHVAKITATCGDCRFSCNIIDNKGINPKIIMAHLPNSSKKYGRYCKDSYIKISLRGNFGGNTPADILENDKADILYLYKQNDISFLIANNYICDIIPNNDNFVFTNDTQNPQNPQNPSDNDNVNINNDSAVNNSDVFNFDDA